MISRKYEIKIRNNVNEIISQNNDIHDINS